MAIGAIALVTIIASLVLSPQPALPSKFIEAHKQSAQHRPEWSVPKNEYLAVLHDMSLKLSKDEIITEVKVETASRIQFTTTSKFEMTSDTSSQSQGRKFLQEKRDSKWTCTGELHWSRSSDYLKPTA